MTKPCDLFDAALSIASDPARSLIGGALFPRDDKLLAVKAAPDEKGNWILCSGGKAPKVTFNKGSSNNLIVIGDVQRGFDRPIVINGHNNLVHIGDSIKSSPRITIIGDRNIFFASKLATINEASFTIKAHEKSIVIGRDCMFSRDISVRSSDSHGIISLDDDAIINEPQSIVFYPHVWVGESVTVLKGVTIGTGSIIGSGSIVTTDVPSKVLVVGTPAKLVRENVTWTRSEQPSQAEIERTKKFLESIV